MNQESSQPEDGVKQSSAAPTLSKNRLKKLKRDEMWEAGREARKEKRKRRQNAKREQRRAEKANQGTEAADGEPSVAGTSAKQTDRKPRQAVQLPVSIIIDCGFDDLMHDVERKSLTAQITRCYSDNQKANHRAHLMLSSFKGQLKERFDVALDGQYRNWRGVQFVEEGLAEAIDKSQDRVCGDSGGALAGAFSGLASVDLAHDKKRKEGEVVYLSSDSNETLSELKPFSTYIVGGLVDRNRHKGICFKAAGNRGIRTAKLPIGDYMQMNSRFVLTVNQVSEILLRWLESGDWGKAFMETIPKRKGGELKTNVLNPGTVSKTQHLGKIVDKHEQEKEDSDRDARAISGQSNIAIASSSRQDDPPSQNGVEGLHEPLPDS